MAKDNIASTEDVAPFIDSEAFWVIWQVSRPARGGNRIRRISQNYGSEARAMADAERYRQSGAVTWVEEARPLAPLRVPPEALASLRDTRGDGATAIGSAPAR